MPRALTFFDSDPILRKFARPWPRACQIIDYVFQKFSETNQFGNTFSDKKNEFEQQFLQFVLKLLFLVETIVFFGKARMRWGAVREPREAIIDP